HDYAKEFLKVRDKYLATLLMGEGLPEGRASCGHDAAWRCLDCSGSPSFCMRCCAETHRNSPLHRVQFWNGQYFQQAWLRQVGVQVHCGHEGSRCPELSAYNTPLGPALQQPLAAALNDSAELSQYAADQSGAAETEDEDEFDRRDPSAADELDCNVLNIADLPTFGEPALHAQPTMPTYGNDCMLVVVDITGIHELPFTFCRCRSAAPEDLQLLALGYYPASQTRPRTVFTLRVLDAFLLANRETNASPRSFYNTLWRTTNSAMPHMVPDRYRELLRVSRQWRNIKMRKVAGVGHRAGPIGPGDLAVRCPACPQPDINLPDDWKNDPDQWKYCRGVVLDGNFTAQHRPMKNPAEDVPFADGHAFTVGTKRYKEHLGMKEEFPTENTCHDHRAVLNTAVSRGKYEATGIGAAACSRHGFFQPHSCVDFQGGEWQMNMDYIVHWILAFLNGLTVVLLLYDIMCQYYKRFHERFEKSTYLTMPPGITFLCGIRQFHVHGHLPRCFPRFSLNFICGIGIQDGEILKTLWNKTNGIADSSRGMGDSHRHELIDDRMNDSNWLKVTRIVPSLVRKWKRVCAELPEAVEKFEGLLNKTSPEDSSQWLADALEADREWDENVEAMDVYAMEPAPCAYIPSATAPHAE
ncbi:hypothetical protein L226DRAFT_472294, partial [Lentinus tigrinus ALCF2SS1-7]|uniref:uncharacterized protein n=1 Tax=Lentinus tigrinus ALCF2SS1-7 TaxID=1328758 RepID=UPI001165DC16